MPSFLTLPPEIRLKIYTLLLPSSLHFRYKPHRRRTTNRTWHKSSNNNNNKNLHPLHHRTALLLVSKLLNTESAPLFFAHNTFILEIPRYSFTSVLRVEPCLAAMRDVEVRVGFGRGSEWYLGRVGIVLAGLGRVRGLRRVVFVVEGRDGFGGRGDVKGRVGGFLEKERALEEVVVVSKVGKGVGLGGLVDGVLRGEWVRWEEGEKERVRVGGRWGAGMRVVHWCKVKQQGRKELVVVGR
ncbi:MAG: hypothetical protein M1830_000020 [Pleopsidium flavum]|nr:MAG: hypothetical protein M1830_000020 [Pleopsidium flavum]